MKLSPDQISHIANLSKLELSEDEKVMFGSQISLILDFIETMNTIDTTDVEPLEHVVPLVNVWRKDVVTNIDTRDGVVAAFPEKEGDLLKVKGVFTQ